MNNFEEHLQLFVIISRRSNKEEVKEMNWYKLKKRRFPKDCIAKASHERKFFRNKTRIAAKDVRPLCFSGSAGLLVVGLRGASSKLSASLGALHVAELSAWPGQTEASCLTK